MNFTPNSNEAPILVQTCERHPHALPRPRQIGELEIDHASAVVLGEGEDVAHLRGSLGTSGRAVIGLAAFH
jgi:hypothetical protein